MIFPIENNAYETSNYTSSPYAYRDAFRAAFLAANPKGSFYAFSVKILSRTEVEFIAYDMRDNFSGGIGDEIWRGRAYVPPSLTETDVERAILRAARERLEDERQAADAVIVSGYADEIRDGIE